MLDKMIPQVSFIVPTRDHPALLEQLVASLARSIGNTRCELIVLDNGSASAEALEHLAGLGASDHARAFTHVRVIPAPGRFNYSALNNRGAAVAQAPLLCLLNDDVEATTTGWLEAMLERAAAARAGCVGARLLYPDGRVQHAGVMLGMGPVAGHPYRLADPSDPGFDGYLSKDQQVCAVTGACLLVARSTWLAVGGMDEALAVAYNDVDFCLRVRAAGFVNCWTPAATLLHHESASRGRARRKGLIRGLRHRGEVALMRRRWGSLLQHDPCLHEKIPLSARS